MKKMSFISLWVNKKNSLLFFCRWSRRSSLFSCEVNECCRCCRWSRIYFMLLGQESVVDFSVARSMLSLSDLLQAYKKETVLVRIISGEELNFRVRAHARTHTRTHTNTHQWLKVGWGSSLVSLQNPDQTPSFGIRPNPSKKDEFWKPRLGLLSPGQTSLLPSSSRVIHILHALHICKFKAQLGSFARG